MTRERADLLQLEGHKLEALGFEASDDLPYESPLDAVRLDHDEGALLVG